MTDGRIGRGKQRSHAFCAFIDPPCADNNVQANEWWTDQWPRRYAWGWFKKTTVLKVLCKFLMWDCGIGAETWS